MYSKLSKLIMSTLVSKQCYFFIEHLQNKFRGISIDRFLAIYLGLSFSVKKQFSLNASVIFHYFCFLISNVTLSFEWNSQIITFFQIAPTQCLWKDFLWKNSKNILQSHWGVNCIFCSFVRLIHRLPCLFACHVW